jgi:hypothetical protein
MGFSALRACPVMFALSLCDGGRHSRSDDQVAALVAKMPSEVSDISKPWRLMPNITHELQPGEMHCNVRDMKGSAHFPSISSRPTTYREKVAPRNLLAWRVACWNRRQSPTLDDDRKKDMGTYLGRISSPAARPDALIPKTRHTNVPAPWDRFPAGMPCTRYTYNLP